MALSAAERQARYRLKKYAQLDKLPKVSCACGCGILIPLINKKGKLARYKHGHNPDGKETQFKKGHKTWNKKLKSLYPGPNRGKKLSIDELNRRTETRIMLYGCYTKPESISRGIANRPPTWLANVIKSIKERDYRGANNPAWLGGKSREEYGAEFNSILKQKILERDGISCVHCGMGAESTRLVVHHLDMNKKNNSLANLQTLCESCHGRLHGKILQNCRVGRS